ncbi:hypothetical protein RIF29_25420 [Crotalaria pallida]|uniref:Uncharacterized protein n=1 Tax=Crotalaria pallida TaxID=3830 RepID=A0AAN9ENQ6_CROPI
MTTPNGEGPPNTKTKKRTRWLTAMKMVIRARSKNIKLHMVPVTYDNWHDKALPGLKDIICRLLMLRRSIRHTYFSPLAGVIDN